MKKYLLAFLILTAIIVPQPGAAQERQSADSCVTIGEFEALRTELLVTRRTVHDLGAEMEALESRLDSLRLDNAESSREIMDSVSSATAASIRRSESSDAVTAARHSLMTRNGIIIAAILLFISVILFIILSRRLSRSRNTIEEISRIQSRIQEESVALDTKLAGLMEASMKTAAASAQNTPDHSLALKIADEVTRIEMNLSRMSPDTRGYKQLRAAIGRIKDHYEQQGYEIVTYLGQPYNEGMRINADFTIDETLPEGTRIITSAFKPQVHYKGELLQKATVKISQNI